MIEHSSARQVAGAILFVLGMALLILSAADYLMGWGLIGTVITVIGIMLVVIGAGLARRERTHASQ